MQLSFIYPNPPPPWDRWGICGVIRVKVVGGIYTNIDLANIDQAPSVTVPGG